MAKESGLFIQAAINSNWQAATEYYEEMNEEALQDASRIFELLVKQHKNTELLHVVTHYKSLDVNAPSKKGGQRPLLIAFHVANVTGAQILRDGGADPLARDSHNHDIKEFAGWSKCQKSIDLAKTMVKEAGKAASDQPLSNVVGLRAPQHKPDFQ